MGELPVSVTARDETQDEQTFSEVEGTIRWEMPFPDETTLYGLSSYEFRGNHFRGDTENGRFEVAPAFGYSGIEGENSKRTFGLSRSQSTGIADG